MNAAEYRKRAAEKPSQTADITLPSGFVATLRRPPLQMWIQAGKVPQSLLRKMLAARGQTAPGAISEEEALQAMVFLRDAVVFAFVFPRLVLGADPADETALDPSELDPADFEFVAQWVMQGSPGIPVAMEGGQVSTDDLSRFRERRPGGRFVDVIPHGAQISSDTEPIVTAV
ncbi:MAG: hypothetical protein ACO24O_06695 [Arenimonas sp.]